MKKVLAFSVAMILLAFTFAPLPVQGQEQTSKGMIRRNEGAIPNQYIVVLKESIGRERVKAVASGLAHSHGGALLYTYENAIKGFSVSMNEAAAAALSRNLGVAYVEEDAEVYGASIQSDATWGLDRIDQRDLPLNSEYNYANSGAGVNVYVIDSGIRFSHQEFSGRAVLGYDFVADGQNGNDCFGHGTHVAAIIGGNTFGVAKSATLHSVRVLDCLNRGSLSRIISAVDWVTANHAKPAVANLSFISTTASETMDAAIRNSIASGVTYVVSAGNNNIDAGARSPSRVLEAITVGATDTYDARAVSSNYGSAVDIFAPGVDILSAWATDDTATNLRSGTSSAAAFVAGTAARYLSGNPTEPPAAVSQAITRNATVDKVINAGAGSPNRLLYRPDSKIAFSSYRDGNQEIYTMNSDGSSQTRLTNHWVDEYWPAWSPDGTKIVFESGRDDDIYYQIYTMHPDGSNVTRLTNIREGNSVRSAWSPDGTKIAFRSNRDGGDWEIYVMNADGTNQTRLTYSPGLDIDPSWSPDGKKIAFASTRDGASNLEIYVMNADGTNQTRITNNADYQNDYYPFWSPDGTKIAFVYDGEGTDEIYVMNADGSGRANLSHRPASWEYNPAWSPDGEKIVFMSDMDGNGELYVMNADGSNQVRITFNQGDGLDPTTSRDQYPAWQPL